MLRAHPAVVDAAVIGIPHERLGEEVMAVVVPQPGTQVTAPELIAFCKERLAAYKYPRVIEFRTELPKNTLGKVLKDELLPAGVRSASPLRLRRIAAMTTTTGQRGPVPRLKQDYTRAAAARRLAFLGDATGTRPAHIGRYSIDPAAVAGNVENFIGVAQVPVGIAGPLLVNGEHARGEFYVPLATTEGTLVASYNRGMKLLHRPAGSRPR